VKIVYPLADKGWVNIWDHKHLNVFVANAKIVIVRLLPKQMADIGLHHQRWYVKKIMYMVGIFSKILVIAKGLTVKDKRVALYQKYV
jgi:hypothetical protein